jgi:hypothetical protein
MPYENRLAEWDIIANIMHSLVSLFGVSLSVFGIRPEAFGAFFGPVYETCVFVPDLAGQFKGEILSARSPAGANKQLLPWSPPKTHSAGAFVSFLIEPRVWVNSDLVVVW